MKQKRCVLSGDLEKDSPSMLHKEWEIVPDRRTEQTKYRLQKGGGGVHCIRNLFIDHLFYPRKTALIIVFV